MDELEICRIVAKTLDMDEDAFGCLIGRNVIVLTSTYPLTPHGEQLARDAIAEAAKRSGSRRGLVRFL